MQGNTFNSKIGKCDVIIEEVSLDELLENGATPNLLIQKDVWTEEQEDAIELKIRICEVLKQMTERERKVFSLRFGLEDGVTRSLEEVAQILGVTRERIRQIETKALYRIGHAKCKRKKRLKDFLDD